MGVFNYFNIGVDGFALIIMGILMYTSITNFDNTQDVRLMRRTFLVLFSTLTADFINWLLVGQPGSAAHFFLYLVNMIYYVTQVLSVIVWGDYVQYRLVNRTKSKDNKWIFVIFPLALVLVFVLTNPLNGYTFTITDDNQYVRGPMSAPLAVLVMVYLICTSIWVLYKRQSEKLASVRKEYAILAGFVVAPFIGALIQMNHYGISLIWPLTSISMLLLYINRSNDEISIDALTGLNNRGSLDKFLLERVHTESEDRLTLILIDVDKFKLINDNLGHDMGDVALREISEIIRIAFSSGNNFIARYGGDEFVVVVPQVNDPRMIDGYMKELRTTLDHFNTNNTFPMPLSISCGIAYYPKGDINTPEDLLKAADAQMYEEKERHHQSMGYRK